MNKYKIVYPVVRRGNHMRSYETVTVPPSANIIPVMCSIYFVNDKVRAVGLGAGAGKSSVGCEEIAMEFLVKNNLTNAANKFTGQVWIYQNGDISFMRSG